MILDVHTHHPAPRPLAVVAASPLDFIPEEGQLYSTGFHPWDTTTEITADMWRQFEDSLQLPCVVAAGECGIDVLKGAPLFKQMLIFKRQIELSEKYSKPLIIHDVKAHDIITGLKKDLQPTQKWLIHGFRYKPTVAKMMTDAGIYLSFGEKYNIETLKTVPRDMILAETDDSELDITEIIKNMSETLDEDITSLIAENTAAFLNL